MNQSAFSHLPTPDQALIEEMLSVKAQLEAELAGCTVADVSKLNPALMTNYPNHGITNPQQYAAVMHMTLSDTPDWTLGEGLLMAMRESTQFMPTAGAIRACARSLPRFKKAVAMLFDINRLLEKARGE